MRATFNFDGEHLIKAIGLRGGMTTGLIDRPTESSPQHKPSAAKTWLKAMELTTRIDCSLSIKRSSHGEIRTLGSITLRLEKSASTPLNNGPAVKP